MSPNRRNAGKQAQYMCSESMGRVCSRFLLFAALCDWRRELVGSPKQRVFYFSHILMRLFPLSTNWANIYSYHWDIWTENCTVLVLIYVFWAVCWIDHSSTRSTRNRKTEISGDDPDLARRGRARPPLAFNQHIFAAQIKCIIKFSVERVETILATAELR